MAKLNLLLMMAAVSQARRVSRDLRQAKTQVAFRSQDSEDVLHYKPLLEGKYEGGRCMDGSASGYYYGEPSSGSSSVWVIYMAGGGGCDSAKSCEAWQDKITPTGPKGRNTSLTPTKSADNELSSDMNTNPYFHDAHHVLVPYCTGDAHSGQVTEERNESWNYIFDGHLNFRAIVAEVLETAQGLGQVPERMLLTGNSAGGKGVLHNCNYLQSQLEQLPMSTTPALSCSPRAGWFMPGSAEDNEDPELPPTPWPYWSEDEVSPETIGISPSLGPFQSYLIPECEEEHREDAWKCNLAHVMYAYINRPMFVIQDIWDTNQLFSQMQLPKQRGGCIQQGHDYLAYYGRAAVKSIVQQVGIGDGKAADGFFLKSCMGHGAEPDVMIEGSPVNEQTALGQWFFGGDLPTRVVDDCDGAGLPGMPCNTGPGCMTLHAVDSIECDAINAMCPAALTEKCGGKRRCNECVRKGSNLRAFRQAGCFQSEVDAFC